MISLSEQIFTFGQAAKAAGITEKQLRNWLARNLIDLPAESDRTEDNWRKFAVTDVLHIATVARLARYGVQIPEAEAIYQKMVGSRIKGFRRFRKAPPDALIAMISPIEIGISQPSGDGPVEPWQSIPGESLDFDQAGAATDYAVISMKALLRLVISRLLVLVEGKKND